MATEMTTLELLNETLRSLQADKAKATALRTSTTSGTGQTHYTDAQRATAAAAHQKLIKALESLNQAGIVVSEALAAHSNAQRGAANA